MKQLSIFIENKGGTLIKVLDLLSKAGIQIIASTIADTQEYGIYRILCNEQEKAFLVLKEGGINVQLTDVLAIAIDDTPGQAANAVQAISQSDISILYMYTFLWKGKGVLVFRTNDSAKAEHIIRYNDFILLSDEDFK